MQRSKFETYRGQIWFLLEYRLRSVQGDSVKEGHPWSSRCHLLSLIILHIYRSNITRKVVWIWITVIKRRQKVISS